MKKIIYTFALASLFLACKDVKADKISTNDSSIISVTTAQFKSLGMKTGNPVDYDFDVVVKASGRIDVPPENKAKVTAFLGGYVKKTTLLIGDKVTKGQALLTLESTDYLDIQKEYLDVAEQITFLKSEFERQKTLYDEKITSQKNYLKAESEYRRAKGMYQSLRAKLQLVNINPAQVEKGKLTTVVTIYAPISGSVSVMNAEVGMLISPTDVMLEIVNNADLHVELSVFEKDILQIKEGQKIKFKVPEASSELFDAEVHLVGKTIEGNDRTINVHGHLDANVKQRLLSGMFVEASIIVNSKKGMAIPTEAVLTENNKSFVLVLDTAKNGFTFKKVAVSLGIKSEKFVEMLPNKSINKKSVILTKGVFDIAN